MKTLNTKRVILNSIVLLQLIPQSIAYSSEVNEDLMLLVFVLNMILLIIIPLINVFFEVKIILKTKVNIISILLILFNVLMFFVSTSYYGGIY